MTEVVAMSHKSRQTRQEHERSAGGRRWFPGAPIRHGYVPPPQRVEVPEDVEPDAEQQAPPPHDQPWVPRSGLVGRFRRSPRRQ